VFGEFLRSLFLLLLFSYIFLRWQKTIVAVLDCLISPRWPHPPCLPSDIVPCLSWEQLQDTPTHFHVTYDILESDVNGRFPDDADYEYTPKSCYYHLAKHCNHTLNKVHKKITACLPSQVICYHCQSRTEFYYFRTDLKIAGIAKRFSSSEKTIKTGFNAASQVLHFTLKTLKKMREF